VLSILEYFLIILESLLDSAVPVPLEGPKMDPPVAAPTLTQGPRNGTFNANECLPGQTIHGLIQILWLSNPEAVHSQKAINSQRLSKSRRYPTQQAVQSNELSEGLELI
jgi:hypothetical protein